MNRLQKLIGWALLVVAVASSGIYVFGGALAYLLNSEGPAKLLGLAQPLSPALLPIWGHGTLLGLDVHSFIWWLLIAIAAATYSLAVQGGPFQVLVPFTEGTASGATQTHYVTAGRFERMTLSTLELERTFTGRLSLFRNDPPV